jgi:hypothetical protein
VWERYVSKRRSESVGESGRECVGFGVMTGGVELRSRADSEGKDGRIHMRRTGGARHRSIRSSPVQRVTTYT